MQDVKILHQASYPLMNHRIQCVKEREMMLIVVEVEVTMTGVFRVKVYEATSNHHLPVLEGLKTLNMITDMITGHFLISSSHYILYTTVYLHSVFTTSISSYEVVYYF